MVKSILFVTGIFLIVGQTIGWCGEVERFPFGIYDKAEITVSGEEWEKYYVRLIKLLADNNMNVILTISYTNVESSLYVMDLAQSHGIDVIMGTGNPLSSSWDHAGPKYPFHAAYTHPSIIAYKYGDEPKDSSDLAILSEQYAMLRRYYEKPILTAVIGENMDGSKNDFTNTLWKELNPKIRFARFYPIRRTYGLVNWYKEKMKLPFEKWAKMMEESSTRPWWYVIQTFGKGFKKDKASYWRFPTSQDLNAMAHIALAYGARGLVGYSLQNHDTERLHGLVDNSLEPNKAYDGSVPLTQYRALGALVQAHAPLLLRHRRGDFVTSTDNDEVLAVPRYDPQTGTKYVYLINKNTERSSSGGVTVSPKFGGEEARDLYTDKRYVGKIADDGVVFAYKLEPGEAQFWSLEKRIRAPKRLIIR